jgi:dihydroorotase
MSKFLALGMSLDQVIAASTCEPAKAVRRPELGHLAIGTPADISVLKLEEGEFEFLDVEGEMRIGKTQIRPHSLMIGGNWLPEP